MTALLAALTSPFGRAAAIVALLAALLLWADHRGHRRASAEGDALAAELTAAWSARVDRLEARLADEIAALDAAFAGEIAAIDAAGRVAVHPVIEREIARDPSLADPGRGIDGELLAAINAARAESARAARADRGDARALP